MGTGRVAAPVAVAGRARPARGRRRRGGDRAGGRSAPRRHGVRPLPRGRPPRTTSRPRFSSVPPNRRRPSRQRSSSRSAPPSPRSPASTASSRSAWSRGGGSTLPGYDKPGTIVAVRNWDVRDLRQASLAARDRRRAASSRRPRRGGGQRARRPQFGWTVGARPTFRTVSPGRPVRVVQQRRNARLEDGLDGPQIEVEVVAVVRDEFDVADDSFPAIIFPEGFARAHADEIAHVEPFALIRADPTRLDEVVEDIEEIVGPVGIDVEALPPLGDVGAAVAPTVAVEVTTLRIAAAVAATRRAVRRRPGRWPPARRRRRRRPTCGRRSASRRRAGGGKVADAGAGAVIGAAAVPIVAWTLSGLFPRGLARRAEPEPGLRFDTRGHRRRGDDTRHHAGPHGRHGAAQNTTRPQDRLPAEAVATPVAPPSSVARCLVRGRPCRLRPFTPRLVGDGCGDRLGGRRRAVSRNAPQLAGQPDLLATPLWRGRRVGLRVEWVIRDRRTSNGRRDTRCRGTHTPAVDQRRHDAGVGTRNAEVEPEALETILGGALPPVSAGRHPEGPDEVALGTATADDLGVSVGDCPSPPSTAPPR